MDDDLADCLCHNCRPGTDHHGGPCCGVNGLLCTVCRTDPDRPRRCTVCGDRHTPNQPHALGRLVIDNRSDR